jgi:hypothetical protein
LPEAFTVSSEVGEMKKNLEAAIHCENLATCEIEETFPNGFFSQKMIRGPILLPSVFILDLHRAGVTGPSSPRKKKKVNCSSDCCQYFLDD